MPNRSHASRSHHVATGHTVCTDGTGFTSSVVIITRSRWFSDTDSRLYTTSKRSSRCGQSTPQISITCSKANRGSSRNVITNGYNASLSACATPSPFSTKVARTPGRPPTASTRSTTEDRPRAPDLLLQLHDAVNQRLRGRWTAGHVNIHRHDAVAAAHHRVRIMVIAAAVGAASHADHPARLRHLVVDLAQRRRHLVGQSAGNDHHIALSRRCARDDTEAIQVIARHIGVDHLHRAAGQAEGHRPQAAGTRPVHHLVDIGNDEALVGDLAGDALHHGILLRSCRQCIAVPGQRCVATHAATPNLTTSRIVIPAKADTQTRAVDAASLNPRFRGNGEWPWGDELLCSDSIPPNPMLLCPTRKQTQPSARQGSRSSTGTRTSRCPSVRPPRGTGTPPPGQR